MEPSLKRADELLHLLDIVKEQVVQYVRSADQDALSLPTGYGFQSESSDNQTRTTLLSHHTPSDLNNLLSLSLPNSGLGESDLKCTTSSVLHYSINTSSPAFMDKLYSSPSLPGIASDLLLSVLNTNSHVYGVSPALTLVEKHLSSSLAQLFGLPAPYSGGLTVPGGAAANTIALLVARNVRFPEVKDHGVSVLTRPLAIFISEAAHYSATSAAQILGLGIKNVRKVKTSLAGSMIPSSLEHEILLAKEEGMIPFFVAATAGTTVRGAFDPLPEIGDIAKKYGTWFHVDACWGGAAIFSDRLKYKGAGSEKADSIAFNPHKMLGIPLTCSFLLAKDLRTFWLANRLVAGYLFHEGDPSEGLTNGNGVVNGNKILNGNGAINGHGTLNRNGCLSGHENSKSTPRSTPDDTNENWRETMPLALAPHPDQILDLASLSTQCGRRPDALKLYFHWRYYGKSGIASQVEAAFDGAKHMASLVAKEPLLRLVGAKEIPCSQVCFYYRTPKGDVVLDKKQEADLNSRVTRNIIRRLLSRGWMVDYAPGSDLEGERGDFLRVVCNRLTTFPIAAGLVKSVVELGNEMFALDLKEQ